MIKENSMVEVISKTFNGLAEIKRSYKFNKYFIDLVLDFKDFRIAIECDENGHAYYNKEDEIIREKIISSEFKLFRYNPDSNDSILNTVNSILHYILNRKLVL